MNNHFFCQYCGAANSPGARFCQSCGREFTANVPPQPARQQVYVPPPVQQVIVQQAPAPNKGGKTCLWIAVIVTVIVICCAIVSYQYYKIMMTPIRGAANDFISFLQKRDYAQAYDWCGTDLQRELGSPDGLRGFIENNGFAVQSWNITNIQRFEGTPTTGTASGPVTFADGRTGTITINMAVDNAGIWKVIGIEFD